MTNPSKILTNLATSLLLLAGACGHTHAVGDTASNTAPPTDQKADSARPSGRGTAGNPGLVSGQGRDGTPPLATSPAGLLKPHAIESIQDKLASNGRLSGDHEAGKLDEPTREALREFQRSNNLPATGMPDDVTIQRLGLGTQDIFRSSQDSTKDASGSR